MLMEIFSDTNNSQDYHHLISKSYRIICQLVAGYFVANLNWILFFLAAHSHSHGGHNHSHDHGVHQHHDEDHDQHSDMDHHEHSHDHVHSNKTSEQILTGAIDKVTESIAEAVSNVLSSSSTVVTPHQEANSTAILHQNHS